MSKRSYKYSWKDQGWAALLKRALSGNGQVNVGVLGSKADEPHTDSGLTIGEIAILNEFGSDDGHVPSRPFLRTAVVWGQEQAIKRVMAQVARQIMLGTPQHVAIRLAGRWAVRKVQASIRSRLFKPNAQSTIDKKGNDYTLRDSYILANSIGFEIVRGIGRGGYSEGGE